MKQIQKQSVVQRLALTQQMRNSLHMLKMGPEELIDAAEEEAKRNPFLRLKPTVHAMGNTVKSSVEFNFGFSYKINTLLTTTLESSIAVLYLENQEYSSNDNIYFVDGNLYGHNGGGTNLKFDYLFFDNLSSYISISRKRRYNFLESLLDGIRLNATTEYITQLTLGINYKL